MAEHAARQVESPAASEPPARVTFSRVWQEFTKYVDVHAFDQEQAAALLQLAIDLCDQGRGRGSLRLEWPNIYAAVATLSRTDSETLHARLTIGFSPAEFKWMLQNKALYTWHSQPVRFQRCLQCMVAKLGEVKRDHDPPAQSCAPNGQCCVPCLSKASLVMIEGPLYPRMMSRFAGQCGSSAEKTCWSCRSRLTDAPPGQTASQGAQLSKWLPAHCLCVLQKCHVAEPMTYGVTR